MKYSSNFRPWLLYRRVCHLTCGFSARWFALFVAGDQHLAEQGRNRKHGVWRHVSVVVIAWRVSPTDRSPQTVEYKDDLSALVTTTKLL